MPKRWKPEEIIKVAERKGWLWVRTRGDHAILWKEGAIRSVPVPLYRTELDVRLFNRILRQLGITRGEFEQIAQEVL